MKIEVLYISACPNHVRVIESIREILRDNQMPEEITEIEVTDSGQAIAMAFPGSPTIRVDGEDVEPNFGGLSSHGLTCRTYMAEGKVQGVPSLEWIRDAIVRASART
jgi:hypothetical protein